MFNILPFPADQFFIVPVTSHTRPTLIFLQA
jgi:hypothetical protein